MNKNKVYLILLLVTITACTSTTTISKGTSRTIYPDMIGVNGNLSHMDTPWKSSELTNAVQELKVSNFRYPAGTLGNYWDWDTGWVDQDVPDSLMIKWVVTQGLTKSKNRYTLENFALGQKKLGFTPVFMLNMLTKDLNHSVRNLLKAKALGLPIKYIEMGNELYFNLPLESSVYPTPEGYGETCKIWIDSLKHHFPDAKYAIIGSYLNRNPRNNNWTQRALENCENADAITFHKYSPAGIDGKKEIKRINAGSEGISDLTTATRKAPPSLNPKEQQLWEISLLKNDTTYANFLTTPELAARYYKKMGAPKDIDIWVTEFNMRDDYNPLRGTWANALYLAKYYEEFLKSTVNITNIHNVVGEVFPMIYTAPHQLDYVKWKEVTPQPWSISAAGLATLFFADVTKGMNKATELNFSEVTTITDDRGNKTNTLGGWLFEADSKSKILLINYNRNSVSVNFNGLPNYTSTTIYGTKPDVYITDGITNLDKSTNSFKSKMSLPPFSFTIIE